MVVWVLVITSSVYGSHFAVVDNIASEANCRALASQVLPDTQQTRAVARCIAVRKVRQ